MSENPIATHTAEIVAPQWAIIELMGHIRYGGRVSKDNALGTPMLRVDVPMKDGTTITQIVNPSSVYRITFCSEEIARAVSADETAEPIQPWQRHHLLRDLAGTTGAEVYDSDPEEPANGYDHQIPL